MTPLKQIAIFQAMIIVIFYIQFINNPYHFTIVILSSVIIPFYTFGYMIQNVMMGLPVNFKLTN